MWNTPEAENLITATNDLNVNPISTQELKEILTFGSKNGKSPGPDLINIELIKYAYQSSYKPFYTFKLVLEKWPHPTTMEHGPFNSSTKRAIEKLQNYSGISLLDIAYKIYSKILTKRLTNITKELLLEEHNGFRKQRSLVVYSH